MVWVGVSVLTLGAPAPAEVSRAPQSVALERSLLRSSPDSFATLAPSRVQVPSNQHAEEKGPFFRTVLFLLVGVSGLEPEAS